MAAAVSSLSASPSSRRPEAGKGEDDEEERKRRETQTQQEEGLRRGKKVEKKRDGNKSEPLHTSQPIWSADD